MNSTASTSEWIARESPSSIQWPKDRGWVYGKVYKEIESGARLVLWNGFLTWKIMYASGSFATKIRGFAKGGFFAHPIGIRSWPTFAA